MKENILTVMPAARTSINCLLGRKTTTSREREGRCSAMTSLVKPYSHSLKEVIVMPETISEQELWGPLYERYLDPNRPHRMLALDGGGIRGVLTLEVLCRMEELLAEETGKGKDFRLCQFFDYIGGTSTGAIIATGLARGLSAKELKEFYRETGPKMFDKPWLLERWRNLYKAEPLAKELKRTYGEGTTLSPQHLKCLLLVVTRNATTDSPWPISSNPLAKYNDLKRLDCNLQIPLWQLVRASAAAPIYFPPEVLQWNPNDPTKTFVFVDGGVTPYNNPAFLLYRMATQSPYRLNWKIGERNLLLISVGTGSAPNLDGDVISPGKGALMNLAGLPGALMYGASVDQDINCRVVGRCVYGAPIDREIGDLIPRDASGADIPLEQDLGKAFFYARYNADLSRAGLDQMGFKQIDEAAIGQLDSVAAMDDLSRVGAWVADQIRLEHFGSFVTKGGV
jgi:patatin-like phospholipase